MHASCVHLRTATVLSSMGPSFTALRLRKINEGGCNVTVWTSSSAYKLTEHELLEYLS